MIEDILPIVCKLAPVVVLIVLLGICNGIVLSREVSKRDRSSTVGEMQAPKPDLPAFEPPRTTAHRSTTAPAAAARVKSDFRTEFDRGRGGGKEVPPVDRETRSRPAPAGTSAWAERLAAYRQDAAPRTIGRTKRL